VGRTLTGDRDMRTVTRALSAGLLLLPALAFGDTVYLKGGGRVSGVLVERTATMVVLETGPGRVSVPLSRVLRVEESRSALQSYLEQADALAAGDALGWARLARWAADHGLATPAREAWERVLAVDPGHPEANAALGRRLVNGEWMAEADALRAQGYVPFEGRWVTPAEHEALVREREADEQSERERAEADVRVREAEARAREAEARAREAEAMAGQAEGQSGGIPYGWIFGGGGLGLSPVGRGSATGHGRREDGARPERQGPPPVPTPGPAPTPAPSGGASRSARPAAAPHAAVPAPPPPPRARQD
jgi:hypothetical protein